MAVNQLNVISGVGTLYLAEYGEAFPSEAGDTLDWTGWSDSGYTIDGCTLETSQEFFEVEVDQETAPIRHVLIKNEAKMLVGFAETDAAHLLFSIANSSVDTGTPGRTTLSVGGADFTVWSLGFETVAPGTPANDSWWRLVKVWRAIAAGTFSMAFKKGETTMVNVEFLLEADSTLPSTERLYQIVDRTA